MKKVLYVSLYVFQAGKMKYSSKPKGSKMRYTKSQYRKSSIFLNMHSGLTYSP